MFRSFLDDSTEHEMYISGAGGTGKTYSVLNFVKVLEDAGIPFLLVSFTHDACKVLRENVYKDDPSGVQAMTNVRTLHSFLRKSPGINQNARKAEQLKCVNRHGKPEAPKVLILDEYSMIGDVDYMDIGELCTDEEGQITMKTLYVGDSSQLPPVGQARAIYPTGDYQIELTKNMRLDEASQSLEPILQALRAMIKTGKIQRLPDSPLLHRKANIIKQYNNLITQGVDPEQIRVLAYTNNTVFKLNNSIHSMLYPKAALEYADGDVLFDSTLKKRFILKAVDVEFGHSLLDAREQLVSMGIIGIQENGKSILPLSKDKYNTLGALAHNYYIYAFTKDNGDKVIRFYLAGYMQWNAQKVILEENALEGNRKVIQLAEEELLDCPKDDKEKIEAAKYAFAGHPLIRARGQAWAAYLTFSRYVGCVDRPYASTVHKVQGKSYDYILVEGADMLKLYKRNPEEYLKLFYTAVSRARKEIWISN
jgi:hypothetical protein